MVGSPTVGDSRRWTSDDERGMAEVRRLRMSGGEREGARDLVLDLYLATEKVVDVLPGAEEAGRGLLVGEVKEKVAASESELEPGGFMVGSVRESLGG